MRLLEVVIVHPGSTKQASGPTRGVKCESWFKMKWFCWFGLLTLPAKTPWPMLPSLTTGTFTFLLKQDLCQELEFKVHVPVILFNRCVDLIRRRSTGPEVIFPDFQSEGKKGTQPNKLWDPICLFVCTHAWTFNFWLSSPPSGFALHPADRISCQWEQWKKIEAQARLFLSTNAVSGLHPHVCTSLL